MKKFIYLFSMLAVALSFGGCKEGTDFDIEYTPIAPIGGQYDVIIYEGYDENKTDITSYTTDVHGVTPILRGAKIGQFWQGKARCHCQDPASERHFCLYNEQWRALFHPC